ncbi:MAG: hypothetical protein J0L64_14580 [Acidobacteria bacterium]|nr:hypothetical protein [Acidobacteriota bacterium]
MKLTRVAAGQFTAHTGDSFTVEVAPRNGGPNFILHSVCYGDVCLTQAPFEFTVVKDLKGLTAVFDWDQEGEWVDLSESDGGQTQLLRGRRYSEAEPFTRISITGA